MGSLETSSWALRQPLSCFFVLFSRAANISKTCGGWWSSAIHPVTSHTHKWAHTHIQTDRQTLKHTHKSIHIDAQTHNTHTHVGQDSHLVAVFDYLLKSTGFNPVGMCKMLPALPAPVAQGLRFSKRCFNLFSDHFGSKGLDNLFNLSSIERQRCYP